jgi:hypothetical protein
MSTIRTPDRNGVVGPFRSVFVAVIVVVAAFVATPADAHRADTMTPGRAGPIVRGETRMRVTARGGFIVVRISAGSTPSSGAARRAELFQARGRTQGDQTRRR